MKLTYLLLLLPLFSFGQNIHFNDSVLKAALVSDVELNTNSDNEISEDEALLFTGTLDLSNLGLEYLNVDYFENITGLNCTGNNLDALDVSKNTSLLTLGCSKNNLTELDLSNNVALKTLGCYDNKITSLDLSSNINLQGLDCGGNHLTSLDIRNGNNMNMGVNFHASGNYLMCISVDNEDYSSMRWPNGKDVTARYSNDCTVGIQERQTIRLGDIKEVYNVMGQRIALDQFKGSKGVYLVRFKDGRVKKVEKSLVSH